MNLMLTAVERDLLIDVLKNYVSDFRMEIVDTSTPEYRKELKEQEEALNRVISKLEKAE